MRIPGGGDLAPMRRRRYGGSYGRRRHRRNVRIGTAVLLLAIGAGAAYLLRHDEPAAHDTVATTPTTCATPTPQPTQAAPPVVRQPAPQQVRLVLLNGTPRNGLAKTVGDQLAAQGFVVTAQANAPAALVGGSTVTFGSGGQPAATVVSRWVRGSHLVGNPKAPRGSVQVVLGSAFQRLSTPAEVAAAAVAPPTPSPTPTTVTRGCPA